ncbi:YegS/Rv2252/BmrU family lipid kinase [candidate division KSB1 bacterium]|nr:YegS/Rv2252/BmrU family lipid kinase [candidate division KSB1 bacterium]
MKYLMLVNPHAGRKRGAVMAKQALATLLQKGIEVETIYSEYSKHLSEIARQEVNGDWQGILAVGGDGTLFEVINGMMQGNPSLPQPLGVIPVGTGNSFSRDLHINSLNDALQKIVSGKTRPVDLGKFECDEGEFYFINILGFGFVADVAHKASFYKSWGSLSYVIGVFSITRHLQSYDLEFEIDGESFHRDNVFVEICNSTKTGGDMIMAPEARIDDGILDVVLYNKSTRRRLLQSFPKIFNGTHVHLPEVEVFKAQKMSFTPDVPKILTPDGEITSTTPVSVSILPGKIRIFDS